jgi:hypothetical protein
MERVDPVVLSLQTNRFRSMGAQQKLELADALLSLALELKASSLRSLYPGLPEAELRARATALFGDVAG